MINFLYFSSLPVRWFDWNEILDLQIQVLFVLLSSIVCWGSETSSCVYDIAEMFLRFLILKRGAEGMEVLKDKALRIVASKVSLPASLKKP